MTKTAHQIPIRQSRTREGKVSGMPGGLGDLRANGPLPGAYRAGQEVAVTMMFMDVRNFTHLSRDRCPHQVVDALNTLFGLVVPVITSHGGHIDKFMGDGLMAAFGTPGGDPDHADRAVAAALAIDARVGDNLHGWIDIGVGLDSGNVLVAVLGSGDRIDVTLIGHAVNMAAHVEAATRQTYDTILLTERTRGLLSGRTVLEPRLLQVNGEPGPTALYAPAGRRPRTRPERPFCQEEAEGPAGRAAQSPVSES